MRNDSDEIKLQREFTNLKVKCECGHKVIMTNKMEKTICSWCGKVVYANDKAKFKGELGKAMGKRFI